MTNSELLKQIPLFKALSEKDIKDLSMTTRSLSLKSGQALFRKGDEGTALYIVKKGSIKIVLPSKDGNEIIVTIFSENDYFGEMALLDGEPRSADAVAIIVSEVLILRRSDFLAFLQSNSNAIKMILSLLSKRLRKTDELLEDTCFLNISVRLAKKLVELANTHGKQEKDGILIDLSFTQKELGDMVGATRESVNKELKTLRESGTIITDGSKILIVDFNNLVEKYT
ncbi:MAG: Crp/Fnr family transcriptional regulator [Desulfobacterales bacterium]|nr:Crp/Fnr family transcriptional regulator [Desulfobacterales bacterium]